MKSMQKGFTLIELMIVVAIIGILAAVAIPSYQDYMVRSKVTELLNVASPMKTGISEYYITNGTFPDSYAKAGFASNITTKMVSSIKLSGTTAIEVTGNSANVGAAVALKLVASDSGNGNLNWTCTATAGTQYVPASCR